VTRRPALALAVLVATALPVSAHAAAKRPACLQIVDAPGDGTVAQGAASSDAIDILSADIASGPRNLLAVLRLKSVVPDGPTMTGATYVWSWTAGKTAQSLSLVQYAGGERAATFDADGGGAGSGVAVDAVVDQAAGTITWTLARKSDSALAKGVRFTNLAVSASASFNLKAETVSSSATFLGGDDASTAKSYVDGQPTCLRGV
jgi:hypothetical protein